MKLAFMQSLGYISRNRFFSSHRLKVKGECMRLRQSIDLINRNIPLVDNHMDNNPYENQLVFYTYCKRIKCIYRETLCVAKESGIRSRRVRLKKKTERK